VVGREGRRSVWLFWEGGGPAEREKENQRGSCGEKGGGAAVSAVKGAKLLAGQKKREFSNGEGGGGSGEKDGFSFRFRVCFCIFLMFQNCHLFPLFELWTSIYR